MFYKKSLLNLCCIFIHTVGLFRALLVNFYKIINFVEVENENECNIN